jgi:hypothetical protein
MTVFASSVPETPPIQNAEAMKTESNPEMKPEYDLENMRPADQSRHRELLARHKNRAALVQLEDGSSHIETFEDEVRMVTLDPDVARAFPTQEAVNEGLRLLIQASRLQRKAS